MEEPNDHLFLKGTLRGEETVTIPVPQVDESLCDGCGECGRFCEYHAIVSFGTNAARLSRDVSRLRGMREGVPQEGHPREWTNA